MEEVLECSSQYCQQNVLQGIKEKAQKFHLLRVLYFFILHIIG